MMMVMMMPTITTTTTMMSRSGGIMPMQHCPYRSIPCSPTSSSISPRRRPQMMTMMMILREIRRRSPRARMTSRLMLLLQLLRIRTQGINRRGSPAFPPSIPSREDVFNTLISFQLPRLRTPVRRESFAIHVLHFADFLPIRGVHG